MIHMEQTCMGCGVTIQFENPEEVGYVPPQKQTEPSDHLLCMRCFRIRHYHEVLPMDPNESDYLQILSQIAQSKSFVVQVVDLFDFAGSLIPGIHRHIGNNPLYVLANKIDLFPKSVKRSKLKKWVERSMQDNGIFPVGVQLCSAEKGWFIDEALAEIEVLSKGHDVYVIGTANVGKSTLINRLLQLENSITTSRFPGTTLDMIRIPFSDGRFIIDTPGVLRKDRLSEWLTPKELKIVLPRQECKPKIYQLHDQQTLFFGGLSRIDYVQGKKQPFVCYVSNQLRVHRTKLRNAEEIQRRHLGKLLSPPYDPKQLPKWQKQRITLSGRQKEDIVIAGLGFIRCGKERAVIDIWAPKGIKVETRLSII